MYGHYFVCNNIDRPLCTWVTHSMLNILVIQYTCVHMYFCILCAFGRRIYIFATTKFGVKNIDVICLTILIPLKNLHTARRKAIFIMFQSIFAWPFAFYMQISLNYIFKNTTEGQKISNANFLVFISSSEARTELKKDFVRFLEVILWVSHRKN